MTSTPTTTPTNRRRRILAGAGGGVAVAAAAALAIPLALGPTTLDQIAGGGPAAICAEVTTTALAESDSLFRAEVTGIEGDQVTLRVTDRYRGDVDDTVLTTQGDGAGIDGEPLVFAPGTAYLISTRDGTIATCGLSGTDTPELAQLYQDAAHR